MKTDIVKFNKTKDFLVCVDSDGCAMDVMTIKHEECFGPALIEEWELEEFEDDILKYWDKINLYSMTRGINRYKGLLMTLKYISEKGYIKIDSKDLEEWIDKTKELSNTSIEWEIESKKGSQLLEKSLSWSNRVNEKVENLPVEIKIPFKGVKEALISTNEYANVAIVSSANPRAVEEEWIRNELIDHVDIVMTQDHGSKEECIKLLLSKGFDKDKVLMIGDAPGDIDASKANGILYYPILINSEVESWKRFREVMLDAFISGTYESQYMEKNEAEYVDLLNNMSK